MTGDGRTWHFLHRFLIIIDRGHQTTVREASLSDPPTVLKFYFFFFKEINMLVVRVFWNLFFRFSRRAFVQRRHYSLRAWINIYFSNFLAFVWGNQAINTSCIMWYVLRLFIRVTGKMGKETRHQLVRILFQRALTWWWSILWWSLIIIRLIIIVKQIDWLHLYQLITIFQCNCNMIYVFSVSGYFS